MPAGGRGARSTPPRARVRLDAIVFHTQVTSLFSVGIMREVPTLISLDATPINYDTIGRPYGHRPAGSGLLDRKKFELNRSAFHAAAKLVTWSDWARRSLIADYGVDQQRIAVLPPGAAAPYFEIGKARLAASAPPDPHRPIRILFVGGDFYRKGGPLLLDCLRGPLSARCELHLVTQCNVASQPNVFVHKGLQPNSPPLLSLFAEADVFVLPTQADSLGLVLMEAAAAGLPAVATRVGGLPGGGLPRRVRAAHRRRRSGRAGGRADGARRRSNPAPAHGADRARPGSTEV